MKEYHSASSQYVQTILFKMFASFNKALVSSTTFWPLEYSVFRNLYFSTSFTSSVFFVQGETHWGIY